MLHERGKVESVGVGVGAYGLRTKFEADDVAIYKMLGIEAFFEVKSDFFVVFDDCAACVGECGYGDRTVKRTCFFLGVVVDMGNSERVKTGGRLRRTVLNPV